MARLESIERELEQKQDEVERRAEEVENNVQDLDNRINEIQKALDSMSEDEALRNEISQNLREREGEKQSELRKAQQLQTDLGALSTQVTEFETINENSKTEVNGLQAIGEHVGEAVSIIAEREAWVSDRKSSIEALKRRLSILK